MTDNEIFEEVVSKFAEKYPKRNVMLIYEPYGACVSIDGEIRFNTEGYNLLYNLTRLCKALGDELL